MKHFILIVVLSFAILCCNTNKKPDVDRFKVLLPDTSITHRPNTKFDWCKKAGKQMGLSPIDSGVNGFEMRLWCSVTSTPNELIRIYQRDFAFMAKRLFYEYDCNSIAPVKPVCYYKLDSVEVLLNKLKKMSFDKLISQKEIPNFKDNVADGITYTMEISTPKYYKLLVYHCPEKFALVDKYNKEFADIIFMLDKHLHFYIPFCPSEYKP